MTQATCSRVSIDKLICDYRYQRPIEERRVARIVENFDPKQLRSLELSKRKDGTYAVIDGQHRFEALKAVGRKQVPALVHSGLSVQEEADLFWRINAGSKQPTAVQRFRAQVFSGDPQAVEISNIVTRAGFKVGDDSIAVAAGTGVIRAIKVLERSYKRLGADGFEDMMTAIRDCWFGLSGCTDGALIGGMAQFWAEYGDRFNETHKGRLEREQPLQLIRKAQSLQLRSRSSEGLAGLVAAEIRSKTGLRSTAGRKDQPVRVQKDELIELASV